MAQCWRRREVWRGSEEGGEGEVGVGGGGGGVGVKLEPGLVGGNAGSIGP